jgi:anthranilate 1,2-dioxygenase small subunit
MDEAQIWWGIQSLHTRYVQIIDDAQLESWPGLFTLDGRYSITTRENLANALPLPIMSCEGKGMLEDRVVGYRRINVYEPHCYRHQVSALQVEADKQAGWRCRSNFLVVRTMQKGDMAVFATGVYLDWVVYDAGVFKFAERQVITDSRQTDTLLVLPL